MKGRRVKSVPATALHSARTRAAVTGGLVALIVVLVLAVQNTRPVGVRFALWSWTGTPLFAVIVVSLLVGFGLGLLFMVSQRHEASTAGTRRRRTLRGRRAATAPAPAEPVAATSEPTVAGPPPGA